MNSLNISGTILAMEKKLSKLLFEIKCGSLLPHLKYKFWYSKKKTTSVEESETYKAYSALGYLPNLKNPKTFNEKIMFLKLNYKNDLWKTCADKLKVKEFLIKNGFGQYVPKTLGGPYDNSKQIVLDSLPRKFVLKTNHDCGSVFICEKGKTNFSQVFERLDKSLEVKYTDRNHNNEWVYQDIKPVIFAEEALTPSEGNDLLDFKFFTSKGRPIFLFVASQRNTNIKFNVKNFNYDDMKCEYIYPKNRKLSKAKPPFFDQMSKIAIKVGSLFDFVRVDLYSTNQGPKIGELTFFSQSGHGQFFPRKYDSIFGKMLDISFAK